MGLRQSGLEPIPFTYFIEPSVQRVVKHLCRVKHSDHAFRSLNVPIIECLVEMFAATKGIPKVGAVCNIPLRQRLVEKRTRVEASDHGEHIGGIPSVNAAVECGAESKAPVERRRTACVIQSHRPLKVKPVAF